MLNVYALLRSSEEYIAHVDVIQLIKDQEVSGY